MTYPTSTRANTSRYVTGRFNGSLSALDFAPAYNESDSVDWVGDIEATLDRVMDAWVDAGPKSIKDPNAKDAVEGELSVILYEGLKDLPGRVLTDRDFWRYCSAYLYDLIKWRQPSKTVPPFLTYFGCASEGIGRECVPHRMFDRAYIARTGGEQAGDRDPYLLARFGAADMWKSHILRVLNGNAPLIVHEFMSDVASGKLGIGDRVTREMISNLRRVRSNVLFEVVEDFQARELVDQETERACAADARRRKSEGSPGGAPLDDVGVGG
jgi:hypothetical protein